MLSFATSTDGIRPDQLIGFFEGWPNPPSPERHLDLLNGSTHVVLALDEGRVVGFATAISDGVLSAYVPLLEVLPAWRRKGLGRALVERLLIEVGEIYMVDLVCDPDLEPFYASLGFQPNRAMIRRNYRRQAGR